MTQEERLEYLVGALLEETGRNPEEEMPSDRKGKEDMLRGLMNVRPPKPVSEEYLRIQDDYLAARLADIGVTDAQSLEPVPSDSRIALWQGDLTLIQADAVVNAANSRMLGCFNYLHECIDNYIHTFAGLRLREACNRQMVAIRAKLGANYEQPVGIPMLTDAFCLPAKKIVHVVGPVVMSQLTDEHRKQLAMCYANTLMLCARAALKSVAFCCDPALAFRFPAREGAEIAVRTVRESLDKHPDISRVVFAVSGNGDMEILRELLI